MPAPFKEVEKYLQENGLDRIDFQGTDTAWGYRENEPIFAIIQSSDGGAAFQSAMSLYWAAAEYIMKPWCLFLLVDELAPHFLQMLENLRSQYNIQIIPSEDLLLDVVRKQLERLTTILDRYIPEDAENPSKALSESIRGWKEKKPASEYEHNVAIETGSLEVYKENGQLVPSRKTIPLTAVSGETRIDGILPRLVSIEDGLSFDTEHRNLPMVFRLHIGEEAKLVTRFEADKGNIMEATSFWSLHKEYTRTKKLAFIEPNTGDILFSCRGELDDRGTG